METQIIKVDCSFMVRNINIEPFKKLRVPFTRAFLREGFNRHFKDRLSLGKYDMLPDTFVVFAFVSFAYGYKPSQAGVVIWSGNFPTYR